MHFVQKNFVKKILEFHGQFKTLLMDISLADGSRSVRNCLTTTYKIEIGKRNVDIQFIVLPDAKQNRTLLGVNFLENAVIVLNMPQRYWFFEQQPDEHYDFADAWPVTLNVVKTIKVGRKDITPNKVNSSVDSSKRKAEMHLFADNNKKQSYVSDFEYFGPEMPGY